MLSVDTLFARWLQTKKLTVSQASLDSYTLIIRNHIGPELGGDQDVGGITEEDVQTYLAARATRLVSRAHGSLSQD